MNSQLTLVARQEHAESTGVGGSEVEARNVEFSAGHEGNEEDELPEEGLFGGET